MPKLPDFLLNKIIDFATNKLHFRHSPEDYLLELEIKLIQSIAVLASMKYINPSQQRLFYRHYSLQNQTKLKLVQSNINYWLSVLD